MGCCLSQKQKSAGTGGTSSDQVDPNDIVVRILPGEMPKNSRLFLQEDSHTYSQSSSRRRYTSI